MPPLFITFLSVIDSVDLVASGSFKRRLESLSANGAVMASSLLFPELHDRKASNNKDNVAIFIFLIVFIALDVCNFLSINITELIYNDSAGMQSDARAKEPCRSDKIMNYTLCVISRHFNLKSTINS